MSGKFLLTIDEGTSSTRTIVYDHSAREIASAQQEFTQHYPQPGWVEHDPEEIWTAVSEVTSGALEKAGASAADVTAIGITNQRETALVWDRNTGQCVYLTSFRHQSAGSGAIGEEAGGGLPSDQNQVLDLGE